jgi:succinate dehydrogenase/fumarate reductase flavoprotein subunit
MELTQAISAFIGALAAAITLGTATGWYFLRRVKKLETKEEQASEAVKTERDNLLRRVTDLEEQVKRIPALEKQIETQNETIADLLKRVDGREQENAQLARDNKRLEQERDSAQAEAMRLKTENGAFERVFALMGIKFSEAREKQGETVPQSDEATQDILAIKAADEQKPSTI